MLKKWNMSRGGQRQALRGARQRLCPVGPLMVMVLSACVGLLTACGDDGQSGPEELDAGPTSLRLVIVSPGRDVGLLSGGSVSLVVRLEDERWVGMAGRRVSFSMDGDPAGSVLEQGEAVTDEDGRASVVLRGGWTPTSFLVRAEADHAAPVQFDVVVSDAGFGALDIRVEADETSSAATPISVVLYFDQSCSGITSYSEPAKVRSLLDSGQDALFEFLPLDRFVSVRAETAADEQGRIQEGCLDIPTGSLRENLTLVGHLALFERIPQLASGYVLESRIDLDPSSGKQLDAALSEVRRLADCPNSPAEQLLDCLSSAMSHPDSTAEDLTCDGEAETASARALQRVRGVPEGRCRGDLDSQGSEGLESLILSNVANFTLLGRVRSLDSVDLASLTIRSYLRIHPTGLDELVGEHRLLAAWLTAAGDTGALNLADLGLSGTAVSEFSVTPVAGTMQTVVFGSQQFLFRPAIVLERAVVRWIFDTSDTEPLVNGFSRLFGSAAGQVQEACHLIDSVVCPKIQEAVGCLSDVCPVALQAWALRWDRAFAAASVSQGADLSFEAGRAPLLDADGNGIAESLGTTDRMGQWDAVISLSDEELHPPAIFSGDLALGEVF